MESYTQCYMLYTGCYIQLYNNIPVSVSVLNSICDLYHTVISIGHLVMPINDDGSRFQDININSRYAV